MTKCQAKLGNLISYSLVKLSLIYDSGMPYIRVIPPVTAVAGEALRLKCPVAGYPIDEIYWEQGKILLLDEE